MLRLYLDRNYSGAAVHDTDSSLPPPACRSARYVELDGWNNTHLLPRLLVRPSDFVVTRYASPTDFDLALRDPDPVPQEVIDRRAELEARRANTG
ncbi:MAG: hypothetical protein ABIK43_03175 [candidate division WOR-3 bacterium]